MSYDISMGGYADAYAERVDAYAERMSALESRAKAAIAACHLDWWG